MLKDNLHLLFPTPVYQCFDIITDDENSKICAHILGVKDTVQGRGA
ncbi:MAG: hypothetical protein ACI9TY_001528 [Alphaproteobacteria bacterium]|jgi:hypothetical protein